MKFFCKFFGCQLLIILGWLISFGACAFVIYLGKDMATVLQGWAMDEPFEIYLTDLSD